MAEQWFPQHILTEMVVGGLFHAEVVPKQYLSILQYQTCPMLVSCDWPEYVSFFANKT